MSERSDMPGATPEQQANTLIDFAERDGQRLGNGERRLIVDYANVIRDYHKVAGLAVRCPPKQAEKPCGHVQDQDWPQALYPKTACCG